jgi:hypothetical protein
VWALRLVLALALFATGLAVGRALEENPEPGGNVTNRRPLTFTVRSR